MRRYFSVLILFTLGCLLVAYSVANRDTVRFVIDPFMDKNIAPAIEVKLYILLFVFMLFGMIVGWITAWLGQGHWRRRAKQTHKEATIWKREAENLKRGIEAATPKAPAPPALRPLRLG